MVKRCLKYIIIGIIVIAACFMYAHINKAHNIYDTRTDNSSYVPMDLTNTNISQSFCCLEDRIDGIAIKILLSGASKGGRLLYSIQDEDGQELRKGEFSVSDIKSGKINLIKFEEPINGCKTKYYIANFQTEGLIEDENIGIYYDPIGKKTGELKVNGEDVKGTMIFRTITHKFDMETFIVSFGFVIYFILFFKILYKLFS